MGIPTCIITYMTATTYTATKATNGFYIRNNTIYIMTTSGWMVTDAEGNALSFGEDHPNVWKRKSTAHEIATTVVGTPNSMKVYNTPEEAKAAL